MDMFLMLGLLGFYQGSWISYSTPDIEEDMLTYFQEELPLKWVLQIDSKHKHTISK